jgi:UDP-glucose 4-epimerase
VKCLVLGGGGFIGSNLCPALLAAGHQVRVFQHSHALSKCPPGGLSKVEFFRGDFVNLADVETAMAGCEIVFHLISMTLPKNSNDNPLYDIESNLMSTMRMIECAVRHKIRKVIFASSGGTVYGIPEQTPIDERSPTNPICSYGIIKLTIEKYLHLYYTLHGLDYCVLRLANPYGKGQRLKSSQGAVGVFLYRALRDELIEIWGDGTVTRDYIYIDDVVSAMINTLDYRGQEKVFNIGTGYGLSLNNLVLEIEKALGRKIRHVYRSGRPLDVPVNVLNIERAREHLGWEPDVPFSEGLLRTIDSVRDQFVNEI